MKNILFAITQHGDDKYSRKYGSRSYTRMVWTNDGLKEGRLAMIGRATGCTASHKGEDHEAWSQVILPYLGTTELYAKLEEAAKASESYGSDWTQYIPRELLADLGITIQTL